VKTTLVSSLGCAKCNICFFYQIALVPACFATKLYSLPNPGTKK
jgi:hypothetical protein